MKSATAILTALLVTAFAAHAAPPMVTTTTGANIISNVRYYLNESTASYWSDAELLVWINDGQMDIAARTQCLESTISVTLSAGVLEYSLNTTYIAVTAVQYSPSNSSGENPNIMGLLRGHPRHVGKTGVEDRYQPMYWYDWDGYLGVYPMLSSATGVALTVFVVDDPTDLTLTSNTLSIPSMFEVALVKYVAAQAFYKAGQFGKAGRFMAEYYAEIDRYRQDYVIRPKEPIEINK